MIDKRFTVGWCCMGDFVFSSPRSPNQADDAAIRDFTKTITGSDDHALSAKPRRVYFESYTLSAEGIKRKIERTDGGPPRRLPEPGRASRRKAQAKRLTGLAIAGELEPSQALISRPFCSDDVR